VLDEEDLIQECKALNGRLVAFLKQPAVLRALLGYLVDAPPPGAPGAGARQGRAGRGRPPAGGARGARPPRPCREQERAAAAQPRAPRAATGVDLCPAAARARLCLWALRAAPRARQPRLHARGQAQEEAGSVSSQRSCTAGEAACWAHTPARPCPGAPLQSRCWAAPAPPERQSGWTHPF